MNPVIVISDKDNVATALEALEPRKGLPQHTLPRRTLLGIDAFGLRGAVQEQTVFPHARHAVSSLSADSRPYTIVVANSAPCMNGTASAKSR